MNTEVKPSAMSLNQVAKLTGRSKGTISKALNDGTLSYLEKSETGQYSIDMAEALRVFPAKTPQDRVEQERAGSLNTEELNHSMLLQTEIDRLKYRLETAETERQRERETSQAQIADLQTQRDQWQKQAEQTLKLQCDRDTEQQAIYDKTQSERQSEQEKRFQAEKENEHLRERLRNAEVHMAELKTQPKRSWSLFG